MKKTLHTYYRQKQYIARVDKNGNIIGQVEKWEAHRKGILHRALTIALVYKGQYIIQHRKHPAFDGVFDITTSSHQSMLNGKLQVTEEAAVNALVREWKIKKSEITKIRNEGFVYYKAKDTYSEFIEHEICDVLVAIVKRIPQPDSNFAYGYSLVTKEELSNTSSRLHQNLAPWVKVMLKQNLL